METGNEIWKDVKDYEGSYQVSNLGRIKSLDRMVMYSTGFPRLHKGKYVAKTPDKDGYFKVCLCNPLLNEKHFFVHRLVATAFIPNPSNKPVTNHLNGVKTDNRVENLEWATISENTQHSFDNKLQVAPKGSESKCSKLLDCQVLKIRYLYETGNYTRKLLGEMFNISSSNILVIVNKKSWKHI